MKITKLNIQEIGVSCNSFEFRMSHLKKFQLYSFTIIFIKPQTVITPGSSLVHVNKPYASYQIRGVSNFLMKTTDKNSVSCSITKSGKKYENNKAEYTRDWGEL